MKSGFGRLFGTTEAFDAAKLKQLYPGGHDEYLKKFNSALDKSVADGFILKADAPEIRALAAALYPPS